MWDAIRQRIESLGPPWGRCCLFGVLFALVFTFAALAAYRPAARAPYELLPTGGSTSATVPMFNAWTIWWNADRLADGLKGYWDAPLFHPQRGAFAFSEPQPATFMVAPIVWLTGTPMPAYHAYLFGSLVLNGLFAVRLLRAVGIPWFPAAVGGLAVFYHPLVHEHAEVLQLMPLWGILWTIEALLKLPRRGARWLRGGELGLAFSVTAMMSIHHALFLAVLLAPTAWLAIPAASWRHSAVAVALATACAALVLLPLLWPMQRVLGEHAFRRSPETVASLSATPRQWLQLPPQALLRFQHGGRANAPPRSLAPGWVRVGLAASALLFAAASFYRRWRSGRIPVADVSESWEANDPSTAHRAAGLFAALGGLAFLLSFGPLLQLGGWVPWWTLTEWIPPLGQVRSVYRFAYFVQLATLLLAALGFARLIALVPARLQAGRRRWFLYGLLGFSGAVVAWEIPPPGSYWRAVPEVSRARDWTTYLRERTPEGRAVVCLPFAEGLATEHFESTTRWMLYQTQHRVPLLNGYSGYFPESWFHLAEALTRDPYGPRTLQMLADADVEFVVIETPRQPAPDGEAISSGPWALRQVMRSDSGVEIWQLVRGGPMGDQ